MTTHCISSEYGSMINRERGQPIARKPLARLIQLWQHRRRYKAERAALKELRTLDDSMLKDIGISRDDVMWAYQLPKSVDATVELEIIARRR